MSLEKLRVQTVRNLSAVDIQPGAALNIFFGANASGKTSLLEAICILSCARSFRTSHIKQVIQYQQAGLTVFGQLSSAHGAIRLGIEKTHKQTTVRIQGETVKQASKLSQYLPVVTIYPELHRLVSEGPKFRRQFLDRGVFHVEHQFLSAWQEYHQVLRQRNAALRQELPRKQVSIWDSTLIESACRVTDMRLKYLSLLQPHFDHIAAQLLGFVPELRYSTGWLKDVNYGHALCANFEGDREKRFTRSGPHRADIGLFHNNIPVQHSFSRGQQKMLVTALQLSQAFLMKACKQTCVILVDDLAAELDGAHRQRFMALLVESAAQCFVTVTEASMLDIANWPDTKVFHVEHGAIHPRQNEESIVGHNFS